ncbi:MAG: hypothetical protein JWR36_1834 [Glaciihabitans sp.]|nr:hypothetical protein [Glaciihabitans sp.]
MPDSLTDAQRFAREALVAVTPDATIGGFAGEVDEGEGATSYLFATTMPGYPGWNWTVTIEQLADSEPTILETELTPAEGALLAPDWVPWSERMEDYRAAQLALGEQALLDAGEDSDVDDDDSDDDSDDDDDDDEDFGHDVLHSGDVDGVDIDELDVSAVGIHEGDEPEPDAGGASEEPPGVPLRRKRARKEQQNNQGD